MLNTKLTFETIRYLAEPINKKRKRKESVNDYSKKYCSRTCVIEFQKYYPPTWCFFVHPVTQTIIIAVCLDMAPISKYSLGNSSVGAWTKVVMCLHGSCLLNYDHFPQINFLMSPKLNSKTYCKATVIKTMW